MPIINNVAALGNSMLQRPLSGALGRANVQNQAFYAAQPNIASMAQEERMRQEQDGLINAGPNRKRNKLKEKALQSPMLGMQNSLPGQSVQGLKPATGGLGGLYG